MSRTIRRTRCTKSGSRLERDYTYQRLATWPGVDPCRSPAAVPLRPLPGVAFRRTWWRFHSDNGLPEFGWERAYARPMLEPERVRRARYRRELLRWLKNPEHEVILQRPKQEWDYC